MYRISTGKAEGKLFAEVKKEISLWSVKILTGKDSTGVIMGHTEYPPSSEYKRVRPTGNMLDGVVERFNLDRDEEVQDVLVENIANNALMYDGIMPTEEMANYLKDLVTTHLGGGPDYEDICVMEVPATAEYKVTI